MLACWTINLYLPIRTTHQMKMLFKIEYCKCITVLLQINLFILLQMYSLLIDQMWPLIESAPPGTCPSLHSTDLDDCMGSRTLQSRVVHVTNKTFNYVKVIYRFSKSSSFSWLSNHSPLHLKAIVGNLFSCHVYHPLQLEPVSPDWGQHSRWGIRQINPKVGLAAEGGVRPLAEIVLNSITAQA